MDSSSFVPRVLKTFSPYIWHPICFSQFAQSFAHSTRKKWNNFNLFMDLFKHMHVADENQVHTFYLLSDWSRKSYVTISTSFREWITNSTPCIHFTYMHKLDVNNTYLFMSYNTNKMPLKLKNNNFSQIPTRNISVVTELLFSYM